MKISIETNGSNSILNVTHVITLPEAFSAIRFHSRFNQDFWLTSSSSQSHHDYNYLKYAFTESIFCACGELIKNPSCSNVQIKRLSTFAIGMIVKNNFHETLFCTDGKLPFLCNTMLVNFFQVGEYCQVLFKFKYKIRYICDDLYSDEINL